MMLLATLATRQAVAGAQVTVPHHLEVLFNSTAPQPVLKSEVFTQTIPPCCKNKPLSFLKTIS